MAIHADITDASPKLTKSQKLRRIVVSLLLITAITTGCALAYREIYLPKVWRAEVADAMARLRRHDAEDADRFLKYPETIRLEQFAERFSYGPKEISLAQRIAGIRAALELADHLDSPAARYIYGTTLLAGRLGMTDQEQAHKQFELAAKKISTLVSKGDPRATFYYGLMINSGLGGLETNNALSTSMILQVVNELPTTDLIRLKYLITDGSFNAAREVFFGESLLGTLADRGEKTYPGIVELVCEKTTVDLMINSCVREVQKKQLAYSKINPISDDAFTEKTAQRSDPEKQYVTGYIKGASQGATGGRSTFTIDNTRGGSDAIGRLYLNGDKPAARSMYVKAGETFKAQSLLAGNYVFRYRFIGSDTTYEADRQVVLNETETETGIRYSTVTLTLFKEVGGNLHMKKVSPNDF